MRIFYTKSLEGIYIFHTFASELRKVSSKQY